MADPPRERAQEARYREAAAEFGAALERLARAYEPDPDKRRDLLQEIHVALWRSFARFDGRCSNRTWVYRVAHNTATSLVQRLTPIDRQVIVLYLEGVDAASIGEVTGLSAANVATKIHRIKQLLVRRFHEGTRHGA